MKSGMEKEKHEAYGRENPEVGETVAPDLGDAAKKLEEMQRILKEMEKEADALREMLAKFEKDMSAIQEIYGKRSYLSDSASVDAENQEEKEEVDARSVYVGNV